MTDDEWLDDLFEKLDEAVAPGGGHAGVSLSHARCAALGGRCGDAADRVALVQCHAGSIRVRRDGPGGEADCGAEVKRYGPEQRPKGGDREDG
jgi:hypothetical protein